MSKGEYAIQLLEQKMEHTRQVLPNGKTVELNADSICGDLERIVAQIKLHVEE